ncbi:hypothetical protein GCM10026986_00780 [Nitrincola alkalisediminis]
MPFTRIEQYLFSALLAWESKLELDRMRTILEEAIRSEKWLPMCDSLRGSNDDERVDSVKLESLKSINLSKQAAPQQ